MIYLHTTGPDKTSIRHLVCGDGDLLGLAGPLVLRRHLKNAVRVDLEGNLDLRYPSRRRREAGQLELT